MDFEIDGIKYYICRGFKDGFKTANFIYLKDSDLIFIDYIGQDFLQSIAIFKNIFELKVFWLNLKKV